MPSSTGLRLRSALGSRFVQTPQLFLHTNPNGTAVPLPERSRRQLESRERRANRHRASTPLSPRTSLRPNTPDSFFTQPRTNPPNRCLSGVEGNLKPAPGFDSAQPSGLTSPKNPGNAVPTAPGISSHNPVTFPHPACISRQVQNRSYPCKPVPHPASSAASLCSRC